MFSKPLPLFEEPKTNKSVFQREPEFLPCFELNYKFLERHKKLISLGTTRKQENAVNTAQKMASKSSTKQHGEATIGTYLHFKVLTLDLIAMLNFQCFRLDTSYLSVSSKWFGNLRKDVIDKRRVNSVKYHYLSLRLVWSLFKKFENKVQGYNWPCFLFANAMTVLTVDFEKAFLSASSGSQQTILLLFSFFVIFIQLCDSRKIHYLSLQFRVKLHLKTDIALIAKILVFACNLIPSSGNEFSYRISMTYTWTHGQWQTSFQHSLMNSGHQLSNNFWY